MGSLRKIEQLDRRTASRGYDLGDLLRGWVVVGRTDRRRAIFLMAADVQELVDDHVRSTIEVGPC